MLEGDISEIHLIERLVELWREQFTGAIRFENDGIIKIVYFKGGDILSASTNDRADSIDEILMRAGKVSRDHVKRALAKRKESETLGDALLNLGFITRKELTWARRVQVVGVIRSIEAWSTGSFTIVSDYLPKRDEGTLFPLPQVLIELIVTDQDRPRFERLLDGGNAVFARRADFDEGFRKLGLNEDADAIAVAIDGHASATEIAETSGRDSFNVYRLLHALATLQLIERVEIPQEVLDVSHEEFAATGAVSDASNMWDEEEPQAAEPESPKFDFDEAEAARQPTMEVAIDTSSIPAYDALPEPPAHERSAWDETDEEAVPEPATKMPAWDVAPRAAAPIPVEAEPPADADEEQWGFDEAQLETARRAGVPDEDEPVAVAAAPKERRAGRHGLLVALMVVAIVGLGAYGAWLYLQKREAPVAVEPAPKAETRPAAAAPSPSTDTLVEIAPVPSTPTESAAPAPAPAQTTTSAPVATVAPVVPAPAAGGDAKARFDAMARDFAAAATGNFTVQIQILCDVGNLEKAVRDGGSDLWFVPQKIGERSCYRVLWGQYDTRADAERALAAIPAALRDRNAAVKAVPKS